MSLLLPLASRPVSAVFLRCRNGLTSSPGHSLWFLPFPPVPTSGLVLPVDNGLLPFLLVTSKYPNLLSTSKADHLGPSIPSYFAKGGSRVFSLSYIYLIDIPSGGGGAPYGDKGACL